MVGKTIFHYRILEKLGEGGMGVVYKAEDTILQRTVALKFLKEEEFDSKEDKERFLREAQATAALDHPNICTVYEISQKAGLNYIVMSFIEGQTLEEKLKIEAFSQQKVVEIAIQIAEGLKEAHQKEIIHRDIKPANIMIMPNGHVKIMDFGMAKIVKRTSKITKPGSTPGTVAYMSPEQARGEEVDERTDIWSLGVILYKMLTGHLPFEKENELATLQAIINDDSEKKDEFPENMIIIIDKTLAKKLDERYEHIETLLVDLGQVKDSFSVKPQSFLSFGLDRFGTTNTRKKWIFSFALIVALIFVGFFTWQSFKKSKSNLKKPILLVTHFENLTADRNLNYLKTAIPTLLINDLNQSKHLNAISQEEYFNIIKKLNLSKTNNYSIDILKEIAGHCDANFILSGEFSSASNIISLDMKLRKKDGSLLCNISKKILEHRNIFSLVDSLSIEIKENLNISNVKIATDIDENIDQIVTPSLEALKHFTEGSTALYQTNFSQAIQSFDKAITVDSNFALAYLNRATSYRKMNNKEKERLNIEKSLKLEARLSLKDLNLNRGLYNARTAETFDEAIKAFNQLLLDYPDNIKARYSLADIYSQINQSDKAIENLELLVYKGCTDKKIFTNLVNTYNKEGMYDKSVKLLERYRENVADEPWVHSNLCFAKIFQGNLEAALEETNKIFLLDPTYLSTFFLKGDIYSFQGELTEAEIAYRKLLQVKTAFAQDNARMGLANLSVLQGKFDEARNHLKKSIEFSRENPRNADFMTAFISMIGELYRRSGKPEKGLKYHDEGFETAVEVKNLFYQRKALCYKGIAYIDLERWDKLQDIKDKYKSVTLKGFRQPIPFYYLLLGLEQLKQKNYLDAINYILEAQSISTHVYARGHNSTAIRYNLGSAYLKSGDLEQAKENFEKILSFNYERFYHGDYYAKSYYMLGKIHEIENNPSKAIEYYEKFLDLWKDADEGLPEVDDAEKRWKKLKSEY